MAEEIADFFDRSYPKMLEAFGSPAAVDVDQDGKVAIVISKIYSGYGGYFWSGDLSSQPDGKGGMDMLHINANSIIDGGGWRDTLAHEYQHLINYAVVGPNRESWLNETFSTNAPIICGIAASSNPWVIGTISQLTSYMAFSKCSIPFIFGRYYTPRNGLEFSLTYGEWFLFGRYLSAQSDGVAGVGDGIYRRVLDSGECTRSALAKVLTDIGVIQEGGETENFNAFVHHYNIATILQENTGIYSFEGRDIGRFHYPLSSQGTTLLPSLQGGGAMTLSVGGRRQFTPSGAVPAMVFAGITKDVPESVEASHADGAVLDKGETLTLTCVDADVKIYYVLTPGDKVPGDPEREGTLYTGPITLTEDCRLTAIARNAAGRSAIPASWTFYVAKPPSPSNPNRSEGTPSKAALDNTKTGILRPSLWPEILGLCTAALIVIGVAGVRRFH